MTTHLAGRKKKRVSRFDRASGAASPPEDEPVDTSGAIMPYKDPADFSNYLTDVLKSEPNDWSSRWAPSAVMLSVPSKHRSAASSPISQGKRLHQRR